MRYRLLDIVACPIDGRHPLKLVPLRIYDFAAQSSAYIKRCGQYCAKEAKPITEDSRPPCQQCQSQEISEAILICPECQRWFSVIEGIPILTIDGLRLPELEIPLLKKHQASLDPALIQGGEPFNLAQPSLRRSSEEEEIIAEGQYWSDFFQAFYDIGDLCIIDMEQKGLHPSYYEHYGVIELDGRDRWRRFGFYPNSVGQVLVGSLSKFPGRRSIEVGCGGGELSLQAARNKIDPVGIDIAFGALNIARNYAHRQGLDCQYIYAEPTHPPFLAHSFGLLLSKDALHHLTDLAKAIEEIKKILTPRAYVVLTEHTGNSRSVRWIFDRFNQLLIPRILRRYRRKELPPVLQQGSATEDVSLDSVLSTLLSQFKVIRQQPEMMLACDMERLFYYAFGKRRWSATLAYLSFRLLEKALLFFLPPNHIALLGQNKP